MQYGEDGLGNIKFTYDYDFEYRTHGAQLQKTMGKRQIIFEGRERGELVRIIKK